MSQQLKKKNNAIESPSKGYTRFEVEVSGCKIFVDYNPEWLSAGIIHVEFRTVGTNPISETGYRSHFIMGTPKELGITDDNIQGMLQGLAEKFAEEEIPIRKKKKRWEKMEAKKKEEEELKEHKKNQTVLF